MSVRVVGVDREAGERAVDSRLALAEERVATDEVALVEADEPLQAGLERRVVGGHVHAPETVCLLEPHRVECAVAEVGDAEGRTRFEHEVVQHPLILEGVVELEAELADVRDP